jgi:hypothetical protein
LKGFVLSSQVGQVERRRWIILAILFSLQGGASCTTVPVSEIHNRPLVLSDRRLLKVEPPQPLMDRRQLESVAQIFGSIRNERPYIADLLKLNRACASGEEELTIQLNKSLQQRADSCQEGVIMVPIP